MLLLSLCLSACGAKKPPVREPTPGDTAPSARTLYDRLGGKAGVEAIADLFLRNLLADPRVSGFFKGKKSLSQFKQQLCQISGGPCQYAGKDMKTAHRGMGISDMQFDAFVEDFKRALDDKRVSQRDESEILAAFAPMRTDVVEKNGKK